MTPSEILMVLARAQRDLYDFAKDQMQVSREDGACAALQMIKQRDAFEETARVFSKDYDIPDEEWHRALDTAAGEIREETKP